MRAQEQLSLGRRLLLAAVMVTVMLGVPLAAGTALGGSTVASAAALGAAFTLLLILRIGTALALRALPVLLVVIATAALSVGTWWWVALLAALGLLAGLGSTRGLLVPFALAGMLAGSTPPLGAGEDLAVRLTAAGVAGLYAVVAARRLGLPHEVPAVRTPQGTSVAVGVTLGVVVAVAATIALLSDQPHAAWVPVSVFVLAMPTPGVRVEHGARQRLLGTALGLPLALPTVALDLPEQLRLALAVLLLLLVVVTARSLLPNAALTTALLVVLLDAPSGGLAAGTARLVDVALAVALVLAGLAVLTLWSRRRDDLGLLDGIPALTAPTPEGPRMSPATPAPARDAEWWKSAVVYQIYPRSFADSDGDGVGDLRGVIGRLDYLQTLGVDVVWLSPVYASPQDDNGYDISDYQDIDPTFGTLADLDELISGLHQRGMRIVMDLVVNHTSDEHPWFVESRSGTDSPKRDWYWWRPARPGHEPGSPGAEPTNWESFFSGPTWELDPTTGEYYLHLFSRKQPDLNWENPEVRQAVYAMMRWWLDRGVDGFRMDVINLISKATHDDGTLPDGPSIPGTALGDGTPYFMNGPRIHEFLQEMHREVLAGRDLITVGEMPGSTIDQAVLYTDPARGEVDMVFTFEHMNLDIGRSGIKWDVAPLRLTDLKANLTLWQEGLAATGWNSLYWNNHDQPRAVSRFGDDSPEHRVTSAKTLLTVLHLLRGTPYVYQGEELGMTNAPFAAIEDYRDIESLNYARSALAQGRSTDDVLASLTAKSRDHARTPMQWDGSEHAGFTTGTPWIAVNPNHTEVNAAAALEDPGSVLHHLRLLVELRHTQDVVVHGDYHLLLPSDEQVFAYLRTLEDQSLLVVANMSGAPATVDLAEHAAHLDGPVLVSTHRDVQRAGTRLTLAPWESRAHLTR
jgi:oligo-1,6-glucosidase